MIKKCSATKSEKINQSISCFRTKSTENLFTFLLLNLQICGTNLPQIDCSISHEMKNESWLCSFVHVINLAPKQIC